MDGSLDYKYHYGKWHSDSPEHVDDMRKYFKDMLQNKMPEDRNSKVLEIGCGMGFTLLALQDMGYSNIYGIDIDPDQIRSCLEKKLDVLLVKDTIGFLSDKKEIYDVVLAYDLIEHIPHEKQLEFVRAVYCALRPGGRLLCAVPNANSSLAGRQRYIDWTHHISFTETSLDFLLHNAGFSKIQISEQASLRPLRLSRFSGCRILKLTLWKELIRRIFFFAFRFFRRLEMIGELGWEEGCKTPLSLNIEGIAFKK